MPSNSAWARKPASFAPRPRQNVVEVRYTIDADMRMGTETARLEYLEHCGRLGCDARVERALEHEADAYALELDVREALLIRTPRYPFESQYFATPVPARRDWLRAHFRAHPERDGVVNSLVLEYRARCPAP
jgi:hypothetical protein